MNYCVIGKIEPSFELRILNNTQLEWWLCYSFIFAYYCVLRSFTRSRFASFVCMCFFFKFFYCYYYLYFGPNKLGWLAVVVAALRSKKLLANQRDNLHHMPRHAAGSVVVEQWIILYASCWFLIFLFNFFLSVSFVPFRFVKMLRLICQRMPTN